MKHTLLNLFLMVLILGGALVLTQWFASNMYNRCPQCRTLNAKRRLLCRSCGASLREF